MDLYQIEDSKSSDRPFREMLLRHLLRREHILNAMLEPLKTLDMFGEYPDLACLYKCVSMYKHEYGGMPNREALWIVFVEQAGSFNIPVEKYASISAMLDRWYADNTFQDKVVQDEYDFFVKKNAADILRKRISLTEDPDEVRKLVQDGAENLNKHTFATIKSENPFDDLDYYLSTTERHKTGLHFLDTMLDGGVQLGEVLGILAPSGGGKSTLGLQLAHGQVIRNTHVAYFSTEQKLKGDLSVRTCSLATTRPRTDFKKPFQQLDSDIKQELGRVSQQWKTFFHFFDISDRDTPIRSIEDLMVPICRLQDENKGPTIAVLDWWGRLRDMLIMNSGETNETAIRRLSRDWLHKVKQQSEKLGIVTLLLHQLSGEQAARSANHKPSAHSAQEDKNFNNMMDWALVLSKMNAAKEAILCSDKARGAANTEVKLRLDGAHCRFVYATDTDFDANGPVDLSSLSPDNTSGQRPEANIADDLMLSKRDPTA